MKHARKITEEQEKKLIEMFHQGATRKELAKEFELHTTGVQNVLWRNGLTSERPGRLSSVNPAVLVLEYEGGKSLAQIAEEYGLHNTTVWAHIKRAGVQCRPAGFQTGEEHVGWIGGRIINSSGYVMVRIYEDDPFFSMAVRKEDGASYVLEHRYVMAKKLGRPLRADETVHHKDTNKQNNADDNLQLRQGRHGKGAAFCCADCGSRNIVSVAIVEPS